MKKTNKIIFILLIFLTIVVDFYAYKSEGKLFSSVGGEKRSEELLAERRLLKRSERGEDLSQYPITLKVADLDTTLTALPQEKVEEYKDILKENKNFFKEYDAYDKKMWILALFILALWGSFL